MRGARGDHLGTHVGRWELRRRLGLTGARARAAEERVEEENDKPNRRGRDGRTSGGLVADWDRRRFRNRPDRASARRVLVTFDALHDSGARARGRGGAGGSDVARGAGSPRGRRGWLPPTRRHVRKSNCLRAGFGGGAAPALGGLWGGHVDETGGLAGSHWTTDSVDSSGIFERFSRGEWESSDSKTRV